MQECSSLIKNMDCHKRRLYIGVCMCMCVQERGGGGWLVQPAIHSMYVGIMCVYNSHDRANNELM